MKIIFSKFISDIKKIAPKEKARSYVGVDIGTSSCKLIELEKRGNAFDVINWAVEPVRGSDKKQALSTVLSHLKTPAEIVNSSLYGKGTLIRFVDLTRMKLEELKKSFMFESDKYFPFPKDQIYTDCFILDSKVQETKMTVLIAAAKKDLVDERMSLFSTLGLQSNFIGLNATAIANIFQFIGEGNEGLEADEKNMDKAGHAVAVLDMGEVVTNLTIIYKQLPRFTRDIFIGGREITKSISTSLGLSFDEAEKLKCNPQEKKKELLESTESIVSNLISEVRLSFDYFMTEHNVTINHLLLCGESTKLIDLNDTLKKHLELSVDQWNPFESLGVSADIKKEELLKNSSSLVVALGLALCES